MKLIVSACLTVAILALGTAPALANADDEAWIAKCIADNADQGQTPEVIKAYCTCMNEKMASDETKSVTGWEKTHPDEEKACSQQAGWKN